MTGVTWYASAARDVYVLPAETVVAWPRVLRAFVGGRIAHLLLPEGVLTVPRRALPLQPLPLERVFPLGAAELPWEPDPQRWQPGSGIPILGHGWHFLFRERRAFAPWGDASDAPLVQAYVERFGPRAQFREVFDRRSIGVKYPQLAEPALVYRLSEQARSLPDPGRYAPVMLVQDRARLTGLDSDRAVVLGPGDFGWTVRAFARADDGALGRPLDEGVLRDPGELEEWLARHGRFWRLEPARQEARLVVAGR